MFTMVSRPNVRVAHWERAPFRKTEVLPEEIGDIVISDVCGCFELSIRGYRYFVMWLELKTRLSSIEFTKNKECITITDSLKHFMAWLL